MLQPEPSLHAIEPWIGLAHLEDAERAPTQAEAHHLGAHDDQQRAHDQRVDEELTTEERHMREDGDHRQRAEHRHHRAGDDEQEGRAVDENEAQMAPTVTQRRELRLAGPRVILDRELADVESPARRMDHHLGGELHSRRAQIEDRQHLPPQGAHPAMDVAHLRPVEEIEEARQERVADVPVEPRHRSRMDAVHPVAHDEVGTPVELGDEARDLGEVVGQVRVRHHDVVAASRHRIRRGTRSRSRGAARQRPSLPPRARARHCRRRSRCRRRSPRPRCRCRRGPRGRGARTRRCPRLVQTRDDDGDARRRERSLRTRDHRAVSTLTA